MEEKKLPVIRASIIKAETPVQIKEGEEHSASDWLEPPLPLESLGEMVKNSAILPQCVRAYRSNIAGYGIGIRYRDDDQEDTPEAQAEWARLQDVVNLLDITRDTKEVFEDIIEAREKYGIAYCEVIRDLAGDVVQLDFIEDTPSVRKTKPLGYADYTYNYRGRTIIRKKKFRKYKQTVGGTEVYFKEFGDPRVMDYRDGKYYETVERQYQANEILEFTVGMGSYGEVRWVGQILGSDGARRAEHLNNNYFINGRHTPLMICVQGGKLTDGSYQKLQEYMEGIRGEAGQHAFLLLEMEGLEQDFDAQSPKVEVKDLASILQRDELFQEYIENNRKHVQSAFNLPDLYVGYTKDFNRSTAQTVMEVTEKQVFQPERASLAWVINNRLLNGYGFQYCEVEFRAPEITNPDDLYKLLTVAEKAGGLPPNKAKQVAYMALGESSEDYEGDWGNIPLSVSAQQAQVLVGQLDGQIKKAQDASEPEEIVSVMKEVRRLLSDIHDAEVAE